MTWSAEQRTRLAIERRILAEFFPSFSWVNQSTPTEAFVQGDVRTNDGWLCTLRIYTTEGFPATCPIMVVTKPSPLKDKNGAKLTETSAVMHVLGEHEGYTKLCHYKSELWVPENTLYKVALKGRIWLEAYRAHLRTGDNMDKYLKHM